jgi:hypothetical protein
MISTLDPRFSQVDVGGGEIESEAGESKRVAMPACLQDGVGGYLDDQLGDNVSEGDPAAAKVATTELCWQKCVVAGASLTAAASFSAWRVWSAVVRPTIRSTPSAA